MLIGFMVGLIVIMVSLLIASAVYIIYQKKNSDKKKVDKANDFDAIVNENEHAQSVEEKWES